MEKDDEDEVDDHEHDWAGCGFDAKETNQANDGEIAACGCLLQGARVDEALGVYVCIEDEEKVIAVGQVDEVETNGREAQDKRGNYRVSDG